MNKTGNIWPIEAEKHENFHKPTIKREIDGIPYSSESFDVQELIAGSHFLDSFVCLTKEEYELAAKCVNAMTNGIRVWADISPHGDIYVEDCTDGLSSNALLIPDKEETI